MKSCSYCIRAYGYIEASERKESCRMGFKDCLPPDYKHFIPIKKKGVEMKKVKPIECECFYKQPSTLVDNVSETVKVPRKTMSTGMRCSFCEEPLLEGTVVEVISGCPKCKDKIHGINSIRNRAIKEFVEECRKKAYFPDDITAKSVELEDIEAIAERMKKNEK